MPSSELFQFGDFTLDVGERRLLRGSQPLHLSPKALDVLIALIRNDGRVVSKGDLLARVWRDAFVEEGILSVHVAALRRALGASSAGEWIETVPRVGYRFTAAVAHVRPDAASGRDPITPSRVYELVAMARSHFFAGSSIEIPSALAAFRAAIDIDPSYAPAHAGLALTLCAQANLRMVPHAQGYADAKTAALRALAMDSGSADAQTALGTVLFLGEWDWRGAECSLFRALEIDPDHTEALLQYGALNDALGNCGRGLELKQEALARAPHSPLLLIEVALSHAVQRRFDETIAWTHKALARDPKNQRASFLLMSTCWFIGDLPAAIAEKRRWANAFGISGETRATLERWLTKLEVTHTRSGFHAAVRLLLEGALNAADARARIQRAAYFAALGDSDAAFEELDQALSMRDPHLVYLAVFPLWDTLRGDPRMADRLAQIGLPVLSTASAPQHVPRTKRQRCCSGWRRGNGGADSAPGMGRGDRSGGRGRVT